MKIFKSLIFFSGENDGHVYKCDTIEYRGNLWLVPSWIENNETGESKPERIINIKNVRYQTMDTDGDYHLVLNEPIPKDIFDGKDKAKTNIKFEVVDHPDISYSHKSDIYH